MLRNGMFLNITLKNKNSYVLHFQISYILLFHNESYWTFCNSRGNTFSHFAESVVYTALKESYFDSALLTEAYIKSTSLFMFFSLFLTSEIILICSKWFALLAVGQKKGLLLCLAFIWFTLADHFLVGGKCYDLIQCSKIEERQ